MGRKKGKGNQAKILRLVEWYKPDIYQAVNP